MKKKLRDVYDGLKKFISFFNVYTMFEHLISIFITSISESKRKIARTKLGKS